MTEFLRFRRWLDHNRRALKDVALKRRDRKVPINAPLALAKVIVATHLDEQFAAFAALVGGPVAESYFVRVLQYAAEHDGALGAVRCTRASFGPVVLTRKWHVVSVATGAKVYDALLASNICVLSADESADLSTLLPADKSEDMSRPPSPSPSPSPEGTATPPPPSAEGGPSAPPFANNGHANGTPRPTRSDIAATDAILTKLCATSQGCPPSRDQLHWLEKRRSLRAGSMRDDELRMILRDFESRYAETIREARATVRREARDARRQAGATEDGASDADAE